MQIKPTILAVLVHEGLDETDITELASRLAGTAATFDQAAIAAQAQLDFNDSVRAGLEATLADATTKRDRAVALIAKITVPDEPEEEPTP